MNRILITGATSAIAQQAARHFAADRAAFLLVGRDPDKLAAVADDLRARGAKEVDTVVVDLLEELDDLVRKAGGCVYPAKDARMSAASFQIYYPQWKEFSRMIDPRFSSSFWRRVTAGAGP